MVFDYTFRSVIRCDRDKIQSVEELVGKELPKAESDQLSDDEIAFFGVSIPADQKDSVNSCMEKVARLIDDEVKVTHEFDGESDEVVLAPSQEEAEAATRREATYRAMSILDNAGAHDLSRLLQEQIQTAA